MNTWMTSYEGQFSYSNQMTAISDEVRQSPCSSTSQPTGCHQRSNEISIYLPHNPSVIIPQSAVESTPNDHALDPRRYGHCRNMAEPYYLIHLRIPEATKHHPLQEHERLFGEYLESIRRLKKDKKSPPYYRQRARCCQRPCPIFSRCLYTAPRTAD